MPDRGEAGEIRRREDAALADEDAIRAESSCASRSRGRERRLERLQVTVVDADEPRFQAQRAFKLGLVVHLDQHVHAERARRRFELGGAAVIDRRHDDQDAIGAGGARFRT